MSDKGNPGLDEFSKGVHLIGTVCVYRAYLEYLIAETIWHLLNLDTETGKIVTAGLDMRPRLAMALALARHKKADFDLIKALDEIKTNVEGFINQRNLLIHGLHGIDPKTKIPFLEIHRGPLRGKPHPFTAERIDVLSEQIYAEIERLRVPLSKRGL